MRQRRAALVLVLACGMTGSEQAAASDGTAGARTGVERRSATLRDEIRQQRRWTGGHSAWPVRDVPLAGIARLRSGLSATDAPALAELAADDNAAVRHAAARLLTCVDASAEARLAELARTSQPGVKRQRWLGAQIDARVARETGSVCAGVGAAQRPRP